MRSPSGEAARSPIAPPVAFQKTNRVHFGTLEVRKLRSRGFLLDLKLMAEPSPAYFTVWPLAGLSRAAAPLRCRHHQDASACQRMEPAGAGEQRRCRGQGDLDSRVGNAGSTPVHPAAPGRWARDRAVPVDLAGGGASTSGRAAEARGAGRRLRS